MPVYPGAQARSFLPNRQSDRCNLPCQGETRHRRPPPFGQKHSVKLLERSRPSAGGYRRTLEDIFQIVIVVFVQAPHGDSLPVSSQLPSHIAVFAAVVSLQAESAVGPQLSLGAKTMWCREQRNQQRGTNRTQIRNLTQ